jgi:octaprenyl-diphosphate synthase
LRTQSGRIPHRRGRSFQLREKTRRTETETRTNVARATEASPTRESASALVAAELELVEARLSELLASRETRVTEIADHLIGAGGKRVRPMVTLLAFRACGGDRLDDIIDVAVALELIHSASLLHDDIIDRNNVRRGRDSAMSKYGIADTLVTGDFLFSRAFQICGRFDERLIHWAAEACIALTEGEVMQARYRHNPEVTLEDYKEIVFRKTASLFEQGARTAAYLAQPDDAATVEAMAQCGRHVGMTFQMIDDLLDITADQAALGKPIGVDVREGNPSLPIVLGVATDPELRQMFAKQDLSEGEVSAMLGRLRRSAGLRHGYELASGHAAKARAALRTLPDSPYRAALLAVVEQLVSRIS